MTAFDERPEADDDGEIPGVSDAALPQEDATNAQEDGLATDLVGGPGEFPTEDGAYGDGPDFDPAEQAVIEGGGGVSEGFEQSEEALIRNATDSEGSTRSITFDAMDEETDDPDGNAPGGTYGEADDAEPQGPDSR